MAWRLETRVSGCVIQGRRSWPAWGDSPSSYSGTYHALLSLTQSTVWVGHQKEKQRQQKQPATNTCESLPNPVYSYPSVQGIYTKSLCWKADLQCFYFVEITLFFSANRLFLDRFFVFRFLTFARSFSEKWELMLSLLSPIFTYSSLTSIPINLRFNATAVAPVVKLPANGSNTISPGLEDARRMRSNSA